jgi:hypothetical protein
MTMTTCSSAAQIPDVATWTIGEAREASDEIRSFPLTIDRKWLRLQLCDVVSPFELSSLNESSSRKSLTLRLPAEWDGALGALEEALVKVAVTRSEQLFGGKLTEEQVLSRYKPITKKMAEYPRTVRTKVNLGIGPYATRFWDLSRSAVAPPELFSGQHFHCVLIVRSLWVSPAGWGLVCDASDLQILDGPPAACPFDKPADRPKHSDLQVGIERLNSCANLLITHPITR